MTAKSKPAILGGSPVVAPGDALPYPDGGPVEAAALAEITERGEWFAHTEVPATMDEAVVEQYLSRHADRVLGVVPATADRYPVGACCATASSTPARMSSCSVSERLRNHAHSTSYPRSGKAWRGGRYARKPFA
jgi:hypothetical protein